MTPRPWIEFMRSIPYSIKSTSPIQGRFNPRLMPIGSERLEILIKSNINRQMRFRCEVGWAPHRYANCYFTGIILLLVEIMWTLSCWIHVSTYSHIYQHIHTNFFQPKLEFHTWKDTTVLHLMNNLLYNSSTNQSKSDNFLSKTLSYSIQLPPNSK